MTLKSPRSMHVRPTPERLKKAIFSSLGEAIVEARVLDLFAGSGSLGIDALSRGAARVVSIEEAAESIRLIRKNMELAARTLDAAGRYELIRAEVFTWLARGAGHVEPFDVILADPPYAQDTRPESSTARKLLQWAPLPSMLRAHGWLVIGHSKREQLDDNEWWRLHHRLVHGDSIASFFRRTSP
jgi:16S rRNA (guanine966-N2)-methyltransferase